MQPKDMLDMMTTNYLIKASSPMWVSYASFQLWLINSIMVMA